jgi:hypothetical protein
MRRLLLAVGAFFFFALGQTTRAQQSDAFVIDAFASNLSGSYQVNATHPFVPGDVSPDPCNSNNVYCGVQIGFDEPCPPGLNCGQSQYCPHTGGCGTVQLTAQPTVSGIDIPYYFGFPNGGFLLQDCTLVYGAIQFDQGDGTHVGDKWHFNGNTTSCTGYAQGVSFTVTTNWKVTSSRYYCGRGGCATTFTYTLVGGEGVASYTPPGN